MAVHPFHLAFPVHDLAAARAFYGGLLGCPEGRSSAEWVDFDLYGHQVVAHLAPHEARAASTNAVDGDQVPVRHFGVVLPMDAWQMSFSTGVLAARGALRWLTGVTAAGEAVQPCSQMPEG